MKRQKYAVIVVAEGLGGPGVKLNRQETGMLPSGYVKIAIENHHL